MEAEKPRKTLKLSELAVHNAHRKPTIASNVPDAITDYRVLQKEKATDIAGKLKRVEGQPPNASNFRQHKLFRDLTELGEKLKLEVEQCNKDDLVRQQLLDEVLKKSNDLAEEFLEAELAYSGVLKEKESHNEAMEAFSKDVHAYTKIAQRYTRCGTVLEGIRLVMEKVISENKCYTDFVKSLAGSNASVGTASHSLAEFIAEFEKIEKTQHIITGQIDAALVKAEKSQLAVKHVKNDYIRELKFIIERLITSYAAMMKSGVINERYEKALNAASTDAVATMTTLAKVLNSAEHMVENLINSKAVDHTYRKKTLAQQFEAIREDYVKKKAILHEYHKARARQDKKKAYMVQAFDEEDLLEEKMEFQTVRLKDLAKKKVKMALISQRDAEQKKQKRMQGIMPLELMAESEEEYNPLEQPLAILDLDEEDRRSRWSPESDADDYEEKTNSEEEEEEDPLAVYASSGRDSLLVAESEALTSFMMAAETDAAKGQKERESIKAKSSLKIRQSSLKIRESSEKRKRQSIASKSSGSSDTSEELVRRMSSFFRDGI